MLQALTPERACELLTDPAARIRPGEAQALVDLDRQRPGLVTRIELLREIAGLED